MIIARFIVISTIILRRKDVQSLAVHTRSPSSSTGRCWAATFSGSMPEIIEYDDFLPNPNPSLEALDVVEACMNTLLRRRDAGLEVCFHFSSDRCRAALGGSLEKFRQYATNPVFSYLVQCQDWRTVSIGPIIAGTATRGAMQTVLIDAVQNGVDYKGKLRDGDDSNDINQVDVDAKRFLWTLQQERRPPRQGCWLIHEVIYVRNAYDLTL